MPTVSVVVESLTTLPIEVHPPPTEAPPPVIEPQEIMPEPSVCSAWFEELQLSNDCKYKFPVIVALPTMVDEA